MIFGRARSDPKRETAVYTQALVGLDELAALQARVLQQRLRTPRLPPPRLGDTPSSARGQGMEASDGRAYQPGDDARRIDWRATARLGKPWLRLYHEERQHTVLLLIDRGPSMAFGTQGEFKAATAVRAAAVLAFQALAAGDRVAALIAGTQPSQAYAPARRLEGVLPMLRAAAAPLSMRVGAPGIDFGAWLTQAAHARGRGTHVWLLSDLDGLHTAHLPALRQLAAQGEIHAVRISDAAEEDLPTMDGALRLISPTCGTVVTVDSADDELRARYRALRTQRTQEITALCRAAGVHLQTLATGADPVMTLRV